MRLLRGADHALQAQRGHLLAWGPVCIGLGIGSFFCLKRDPDALIFGSLFLTMIVALFFIRKSDIRGMLAMAIFLAGLGFCITASRSYQVSAPILSFRYFGPIEGRVIALDRSGSGALRMTLDQVRLVRVAPAKTPERVRLSLGPTQRTPLIGARVATTGHLMPPQGPSEPGGFDYRRHAWFLQLGANGYTRNPVLTVMPPQSGLALQRFRQNLSQLVQHRLDPAISGFAAAIIAGDRSGVTQQVTTALRASNLSHLLAISGLHMGLLSGFVFAFLRFGLCLCPPFALRWNVKKISAGAALVTAMVYLGISGGNVSTERAFIMVSVLLCAVLLDRRALSLRAVAVAAILVLLRRPETLLSPGFQMSFAATTALVAVFGWIRLQPWKLGPTWLRPVFTVVISSAVAGLATAPFGAAHFNTLSHYGLVANVLAVPVMGAVVVPSAVLSLCLAPFGLEEVGFWLLERGLRWILWVATWVSGFPNAQSGVPSPNSWVLPVFSLGALIPLLWQGGRLRWCGIPVILLSLGGWAGSSRPVVLISSDGGLVGVLTPAGRAVSRKAAKGYVARSWLAADGDLSEQAQAAARWSASSLSAPSVPEPAPPKAGGLRRIKILGFSLTHVVGKRQARAQTECSAADLVVTNVALDLRGPCRILTPALLLRSGSIKIGSDGILVSARDVAGNRPWSRPWRR
ncbi:ComEC/Rec2 family competence protein [Pseudophaeobacter profundi]|uniref:ComEC/Rec2 family competence protein n=1 Tax=Pseudophaeobacter profundi TaxID=3034152 RepID=UPI00242A33B9|nr:ComEC/Rec2 family competence protein [Pseudophaeobacter profundi]